MKSGSSKTKMKSCTAAFALTVLLVVVVFAAITAQAQTYNINFPAPTTFFVTDTNCEYCPSTAAVATGDFNGDGKLDVINTDGSNLNVMLGNGDGTFQDPIITYIGGPNLGAYALAVGDFNGDNVLDVAVWVLNANVQPNGISQVTIYLGNGNGTFTAGQTYQAPNSGNANPGPTSIVAEDVNGDGNLDIVAMTPYDGVYVFLGNGNGTFQSPVNYATDNPNGPNQGLAVGDVNGDGHPDIALNVGNGINVLLNNGNGTFGAAAFYASTLGGFGSGIAIGDVDGDKNADIVIASNYETGFAVFLNEGNGTFKEGATVSIPNVGTVQNLVLADLSNNGKLDVLVPDMFGNVYTFYGTGKGTFTTGPTYPLEVYGGGVFNIAVGDFNGDGALDLLDTAAYTTNTVSLGRGDGSFQTAQFYPFLSNVQAENLVVADFNNDGIPDVAAQGQTNGTVAVVFGASHGTLGTKQTITTVCANEFVYGIATGDVNGDGNADLVTTLGGSSATCNHKVAVLLGLGTGKFKKPVLYPTGAASAAQEMQIYLVDLTGDGNLDIVTSNSDGTISVLLNKGNGTYSAPNLITSIASINPYDNQLTFADFNGDGKLDIAVGLNAAADAAAVEVLLGNGNGTFGSPIPTSLSTYQTSLVAGDFTNNGTQDLFVVTNGYGCTGGPQSGYLFLQGNGNGTFTPGTQQCDYYAGYGVPIAADMNADGKLDVVIPFNFRDYYHSGVAILQGNGDGTFNASQVYYTGYGLQGAGIADFNGDGMPDVAAANAGNGYYVSVMLNATQPVSISPLNVNYGSVTVGDKKAETVILTNDQSTSLSISSITVGGTDPGDFSETSNCGSSRKAGWDCTITVTFKPTATGARTATLSIKDAVGTQTVQLSGTGQ